MAHGLLQRARPGDRVLLLLPNDLQFVGAFFGCLAAGLVAVPAHHPPQMRKPVQWKRLQAIVDSCAASLIVVPGKSAEALRAMQLQEGLFPGCTIEAKNFQRDLAKYEAANTVILGVSVDNTDSHKEFCAKEGLSFKLLSDTDAKVSTDYGSIIDYQGSKLSARNTFIIDPNGKIAKVFPKVNVKAHSEEVLAALAELQKS